MSDSSQWRPAGLQGLIDRLSEAKDLLEQAAALAAARDAERVRALAELQRQANQEQANGPSARRRYR
jgi:hypothetical protein